MKTDSRSLWQTRGWRKTIKGGSIIWNGRFHTAKGIYQGLIQCTSGKEIKKKYNFYSYVNNPPKTITRHPNKACVGKVKEDWWQLHWPKADGIDQVIINTEAAIEGKPAFERKMISSVVNKLKNL